MHIPIRETRCSNRFNYFIKQKQSLLNCVPYVLTCQLVLRAHMLTCIACSRAYVPTCLECLRASHVDLPCVLMWSRVNVASVLTCSHGNVSCVPTCSIAIISNNRNKFPVTCFLLLWKCIQYEKCKAGSNISRSIYFENSVVYFCISVTRQKPLTGAITKFVQ